MKSLLNYLLVFLFGVGAAMTVTSFFLPPVWHSAHGEIGIRGIQWTLEDFDTINGEQNYVTSADGLVMVVTPDSSGYEIHSFDKRLRARFGFTDRALLDARIDAIHNRMEELRGTDEE